MKKLENITLIDSNSFIGSSSKGLRNFFYYKKLFYIYFIKRLIDLGLSIFLLTILIPIIILLSILIKLDSRGPVFFNQIRFGIHKIPFSIYKFRTMYNYSEKDIGPVWTKKNDKRITKFGGFLRRYHLDELPQLFNVIKGDMSLIGPRPERPYFVDKLSKHLPLYNKRLKIKPGITGWAQINQSYDKNIDDVSNKLILDFYYINNISFWFDIKILIKSVAVVLSANGI